VTSSHPIGYVQIKVRRRLRKRRLTAAAAVAVAASLVSPWALAVGAAAFVADAARGLRRMGSGVRIVVEEAAQ
jgi:4-amino-4-deoxy-L-arabinose transferase-like glycosyltransferase